MACRPGVHEPRQPRLPRETGLAVRVPLWTALAVMTNRRGFRREHGAEIAARSEHPVAVIKPSAHGRQPARVVTKGCRSGRHARQSYQRPFSRRPLARSDPRHVRTLRTSPAAAKDGPEHAPKYLAANAGSHASRRTLRRRLEHALVPAPPRAGVAEEQVVQ